MSAGRGPILIQGPGSIGRLLAARFDRAGIPVVLLGRRGVGELSISLHEEGRITHRSRHPLLSVEEGQPTEESDRDAARRASLWIIATKAYDVVDAVRTGAPLTAPGTPVLVLANGLGHDESLGPVAGDRPALLGTLSSGACAVGADAVHALGEGPVRVGPRGVGDAAGNPVVDIGETLASVAALFRAAGFDTSIVEDGRSAQWAKAALNCGLNPVAALLGLPNGAVPATPYFRWAVEAACETAGLARASGLDLPAEGWRDRLVHLCRATAENHCSMLQDLEAGRRLEIDQLNGWVARRARRLHVPAPRNRRLAEVLSSEHAQQLLRLQRSLRTVVSGAGALERGTDGPK